MADLTSLMKVAPISGGMRIGQAHSSEMATADVERQRLAALVQELQMKNQYDQQANPFRLEKMGLENQGLKAGLPGIVADSALKGTNATKAAGTLQSDIAAGNAKNEDDISKYSSDQQNRFMEDLLKFGTALEGVPPALHATTLRSMLKTNNPMAEEWIKSVTTAPEGAPARLRKLSEALGAAAKVRNPTYLSSVENEASRRAGRLEEVKETGRQQRLLEADRIRAGKYAKKEEIKALDDIVRKQIIDAKGSAFKMYNIYRNAALIAERSGAADKAAEYQALMDGQVEAATAELKQVRGGTADPAQLGVPTIPTPGLGGSSTIKEGAKPKLGTKENPIKLD